MDRRDDIVQIGQQLILEVQTAIGQNVHLRPRQKSDPAQLGVDPMDLLDLLGKPLGRLAVGDDGRLRVVRDAEELIAPFLRRLGHLFDTGAAVRRGRMRMKIAPDIFQPDQPGQRVVPRRLDLAAILPQDADR